MNGLNAAEPSYETDISEIFLCLLRFESACELEIARLPVRHPDSASDLNQGELRQFSGLLER